MISGFPTEFYVEGKVIYQRNSRYISEIANISAKFKIYQRNQKNTTLTATLNPNKNPLPIV